MFVLRVVIGMDGGRREDEVGAQPIQLPSFLAHFLPVLCEVTLFTCHPKFARWGLVIAVGLYGLHLQ